MGNDDEVIGENGYAVGSMTSSSADGFPCTDDAAFDEFSAGYARTVNGAMILAPGGQVEVGKGSPRSLVLGNGDGNIARCHYRICDEDVWKTRELFNNLKRRLGDVVQMSDRD